MSCISTSEGSAKRRAAEGCAKRRPAEGGAKRRPTREALRAGEQAKQEPTETRSNKNTERET